MPDVLALLARVQRRQRWQAMAPALLAATAAAAAVWVILAVTGVARGVATGVTATVLAAVFGVLAVRWWRRWTVARAAAYVEQQWPSRNLVVTAEEVASGRVADLHPLIRDEVLHRAYEHLARTPLPAARAMAAAFVLPLVAAGALVLLMALPPASPSRGTGASMDTAGTAALLRPGDIRVIVTAPAYTRRPPVAAINPGALTLIEGSRVRIEALRSGGRVVLQPGDGAALPPLREEGEQWIAEFTPAASMALVIAYPELPRAAFANRLLQLQVERDAAPLVQIRAPGKDLVFAEPRGVVDVTVDARDDLALASLRLRYTRVSGSGETFTFTEGEVPLQIARQDAAAWQARGRLALDRLPLEDGDTLVYRAVAADARPGAEPAASESFLIEIGRVAGVASTGFAVDENRDRQGLSQQMLIIKTERLHAQRGTLAADALREQSRLLAIEQRMVRAEFVFMTGGEVVDEVEEAEHAHELAEGRLENAAQVELLNAIREMSRAEARLNAADTAGALAFERAALRALQRAFDRRRYLLRTMPERTRIDPARRLSGSRGEARSSTAGASVVAPDPMVVRAREAMARVGRVIESRTGLDAAVAAAVLRVDPESAALQTLVARLTAADTREARRAAARAAQRELAAIVRRRLAPVPPAPLRRDPLHGRLADERRGGTR